MNRNRYRLVFNRSAGMLVPQAEISRGRGKSSSGTQPASVLIAGLSIFMWAGGTFAEVPVPTVGGSQPNFVTYGQAGYQVNGNQALVNQVGNKAILNWKSFNLSPGASVQFRQVDDLVSNKLTSGASFTTLNRIWDINPSVIAGSITQGAGQKANVILVNNNGIAFMGGSQVNLNSFTATSLNMGDEFVKNAFLTSSSITPQFTGDTGFIKVFENASITAGSQGRVMLLAPTVVNKGNVSAPDGQVILAAGTKVFLRSASGVDSNVSGLLVEVASAASLADFNTANDSVKNGNLDGATVNLLNAADDKLGHATNQGTLTTERGNITMVGYAVNQMGIARATTSVANNGSVYLLAKDGAISNSESLRGGRVTLGAGSQTTVSPDMDDKTLVLDQLNSAGKVDPTTTGTLAKKSQVLVLGQDVRMEGGATIKAQGGEVGLFALDNPSLFRTQSDPLTTASVAASTQARVHIAAGASIDVSGLENVAVDVSRNTLEVELRGDELKDSPVNRQGPLRGQKVWVDIDAALANAVAGKSTLIATDSLNSYQAKIGRSVAERSTTAGTVTVQSQGEAILSAGANINLSGGSIQYSPGTVRTTYLFSPTGLVDVANATADTYYSGNASQYLVDYTRWNKQDVIELGQIYRYDPGYVVGKNAGTLQLVGMGATVMQANVDGRITVGARQRESGTQPALATLRIGSGSVSGDYKQNQALLIARNAGASSADLAFGGSLPDALKDTLTLNPELVGEGKVGNLELFSNQAAEVRDVIRAPMGGSVAITAKGVNVNADISAASGNISLSARGNAQDPDLVNVHVASGVTLAARGTWTNDLPSVANKTFAATLVNGGNVSVSASGDVAVDAGSLIDVTGGARLKPNGKLTSGNGGNITLTAGAGASAAGTHTAAVTLDGALAAYGLGKGGKLSINTAAIQLGGTAVPGTLNLSPDLLSSGGFAEFSLTGRDGLTVASGTHLQPMVKSLQLLDDFKLKQTGSPIEAFSTQVYRADATRQAASLSLTADGQVAGNLKIEAGAVVQGDDLAKINLAAGNQIEIQGQVRAAGGVITATLTPPTLEDGQEQRSAIWLGKEAVLDVSGRARLFADKFGGQTGDVLAGGGVSLVANQGFVVAQEGSLIAANGVAPVRVNVPSQGGSVARDMGSDAGSISVSAHDGIYLEGTLQAHGGSAAHRGGSLNLNYVLNDDDPNNSLNLSTRVLQLTQSATPVTSGLEIGAGPSTGLPVQAKVAVAPLLAAGFENLSFQSRYGIRFDGGVDVASGGALPLRQLEINAPRIETTGGNVNLAAHVVRIGNLDAERQGQINTPVLGTGALSITGELVEAVGNHTYTGMADVMLTGAQELRLVGLSTTTENQPVGVLKSAAALTLAGGVVTVPSYHQYTVDATGSSVEIAGNGAAPSQPLSAFGSLTVKATDIVQAGNVWLPFGNIELDASHSLTLKAGSLTSIAADVGSVLPAGKTENGKTWSITLNGSREETSSLPSKTISVTGAQVDLQAGATVNLAGGGDVQAYEVTVGPGGSHDILTDANTYAILPKYTTGFAPVDVQESFDRKAGTAVYLSGVPGLADGTYTLLPAHYALLPGAYAVRLNTGSKEVLPGQGYQRQDGVQVAAGYVTDTRTGAPTDALWQGIQVLSSAQVKARTEFTLSSGAQFFAGGSNLPQDAGLLSITATGSGNAALRLDAMIQTAAASGGRGAALDISAQNLVIKGGAPTGLDAQAVVVDADKLSSLGAQSILLGATRRADSSGTVLNVGASEVTLANDADHPLVAAEIMLAATDTVRLVAGSSIQAQGAATDAGNYTTTGQGAFVRAATSVADFIRSGNPGSGQGTLVGDAGSQITAAKAITLDATSSNAFAGQTRFAGSMAAKGSASELGTGVLSVGSSRISLGAVPAGTAGLNYSQADLDALGDLQSLVLTSYSTIDLYGGVSVGAVDASGQPMLQSLSLQSAGLVGVANAGQTAHLQAQQLTLGNAAGAALVAGGALGTGQLAIHADTLTLGAGTKAIQGFGSVDVQANELLGQGTGATSIASAATLSVARLSGASGANQSLLSNGVLSLQTLVPSHTLADVTALGSAWSLSGTYLALDTQAILPSGSLTLSATAGDVSVGAHAVADVSGRTVSFFDASKSTWGGKAQFNATGQVSVEAGARIDVSGAAGADGGTLAVSAANGAVSLADGTVFGRNVADASGVRGDGAAVQIDVGSLASFSALNTSLNSAGFEGERVLRVRSGDVVVAATDVVKAANIDLSVDSGTLNVAGSLDASGLKGGRIQLAAGGSLNVQAGASLKAVASGIGNEGGTLSLSSVAGNLNLASGSSMDVSGGTGGVGGTLELRAKRTGTGAGAGVAVTAVDSNITGANSVSLEGTKVYSGINTLTATGASAGSTLSLATLTTDNTIFANNYNAIKASLGKSTDSSFHILSGVEVQSTGNLTLGADWNLAGNRAGGEAGVLTLRAAGNLNLNSNLSDGFSAATAFSSGTTPATLRSDNAWSCRLVAGADTASANTLAVKGGSATDVVVAAGKLVRTGTGSIEVASGRDIKLADKTSVIYTAGRLSGALSGFTVPTNGTNFAQFSEDGGNISLNALRDVLSDKAPTQLYSNWLFRQGSVNSTSTMNGQVETYARQPAWWVRFDQFQQGIGALGGGDVTVHAGGQVRNLSVSTPTQGRTAGTSPDTANQVITGGGDVRVSTDGNLLGGQFYADAGTLSLKVGGSLLAGDKVGTLSTDKSLFPILALGYASAKVQATGSETVQAILNPMLVAQSSGTATTFNIANAASPLWSLFSTYGEDSQVSLLGLGDSVNLRNDVSSVREAYKTGLLFSSSKYSINLMSQLPPSLYMTAFQGDVSTAGAGLTLTSAPQAQMELMATQSVNLSTRITLSDKDPALLPNAIRPASDQIAFDALATSTRHAATPVHKDDVQPVRVYAVAGDITGSVNGFENLNLPKAFVVKAGQDVKDLGISAQHVNDSNQVSKIEAGRDIAFTESAERNELSYVWMGGPGRLEVTAGRDINLGTSAGIVSRGALDNVALPNDQAVRLELMAGVGAAGIDYTQAVERLAAALEVNAQDVNALWQARWLTGRADLDSSSALSAVRQVASLSAEAQRGMVRSMLFTALKTTGTDHNDKSNAFVGTYERGYAALETVFPGISEKNVDGSFKNYKGDINLFASRVMSERGSDIELLAPGGNLVVGLANTPASVLANSKYNSGAEVGLTDYGPFGIVNVQQGDIRGFARGNMLVNQSRILTVGGGNVLLWSSEGDIDAGKGKKTAASVPAPIVRYDSQGNVTREEQGSATGSGIGALVPAGVTPDEAYLATHLNVALIAPKGTVNAGDAGIRAGNLTLAAQVVLGADNISASGASSGTPVADNSAVTASASGATSTGDDVSKTVAAMSQAAADASRNAQSLKDAIKPSLVRVDVLGFGE